MSTEVELFELPSGRVIEVLDTGPDDGQAFVFHFGTPGVAAAFPPLIAAAGERGLRTIIMSRPGYRDSTRDPARVVADVAADTASVLDGLGAATFICAGWSGGGPHALACSALLRERCLGTATIAGVAPYGADGLDWLEGMGPENVEEFTAALAGEEQLRAFLEKEKAAYADVQGPDIAAALGGLVSEVDKAALTGDFADFMAANMRAAVGSSIEGWLDDDLAFTRPWGFDLADVGPVSIWQGAEDRMVPPAHGRWLAEHVPGARVHLYDKHGHLSLAVASLGLILDDLVSYL
ncbi:MAG: alpha/beta fold hydrolase [Nitriliruptorales bacterium]|nr:alpha/beta fold hydrolase [Nitriliruptorales bacterium]